MKLPALASFAVVLLVFLASCEKHTNCCVPPPIELLPLHVGNTWTLKPRFETNELPENYRVIHHIDIRKTFDGKEYVRMVSNVGTPEGNDESILYYRIANSQVYVRGESGGEKIMYRMRAEVGDRWDYDGAEMRLSAISDYTFTNKDTTLSECRTFLYDHPSVIDEEYMVILAPRLGFVSQNGMWENLELSEAVIEGKRYTFF